MITRRDVAVALVAVSVAVGAVAVAAPHAPNLQTTAFEWEAMRATPTAVGALRQVYRGPTATLDEIEIHVTTLNPAVSSHEPHRHPNEEVVIVKAGTLEWFVAGQWKRVGPGSVLFAGSNESHGIKNVGTTPATYHVISWTSPACGRERQSRLESTLGASR